MEIYIYIKLKKSPLALTTDYFKKSILYIKNRVKEEGDRCKGGDG